MATSGSKTVKITDDTSLLFTWTRTSFSVENNNSTIYWEFTFHCKSWFANLSSNNPYVVEVNGNTYEGNVESLYTPLTGGIVTLATGTTVIPHNVNGSRTFAYSFAQSIQSSGVKSGSGVGTLDPISRPATILTAPNFNDEENPTITYSNPSGESVLGLAVAIKFPDSVNEEVAYREISKTGTSYTFQLTDAERKALREKMSQSSASVQFVIRTRLDKYYWSNLTKTLTLINYLPTLSPTIKDVNDRTISLTGDANKLIKYHSNAQVIFGASPKKEATIVSRRVICGSQTIEVEDRGQDTVTINGVDSNTFYLQATDNRNCIANEAPTKTLIEYVKLTNNIKPGLLTANGTLPITVSGKYFNGSFGAKSNTMEIEYAIKDDSGNFVTNPNGSGWQLLGTVTPDVDDEYNYTYSFTASGLDYTKTYTVMVNVIDELTPVQTASKVVAAIPLFDWDKDSFRHHTGLHLDNNKTLYGTKSDGTQIDAFNPCNQNGLLVIGWGGYDTGYGSTNIMGNNLRLNYNESLTINGREYGQNKVLWRGGQAGSHMNASQSATLSESILSQPNGIVLVFSAYDTTSGFALDVSWTTHFVPKYMVNINGNGGQTFLLMNNAGFGAMGAKYLYITDTKITGHSGNTQTGTNSGITFRNNEYVLRYVIGV